MDGGSRREPGRAGKRDRGLMAAVLIPAAGLFVPLLLPLIMGRVFASDDLAVFHLPLRLLFSEALSRGESILWTPHLFNGFYLHAEGQVGALHPLHLALYGFAPLVVAFNVELILSYVAAFAGMWIFLARLGLSRAAALVGATGFAFSGFNLLHLSHMNAVAIAAHIPWLLAAIDVLMCGPPRARPFAIGALALLVGSQVLLGYPQYVWISSLTVALYALMRAWSVRRWGAAILAGAGCVLGLAVGAAQLLPTLDLFERSVRPVVSPAFRLTFSLHPLNLFQLWSPYLFEYRVFALTDEHFAHEFGLYNGALCTIALVWVLFRWRRLHERHVAAAGLVFCAVGLVLALGRYGLLYEQLTILPVVAAFRAPARHVLMVHVGLSLLLAVMFEDIGRMAKVREKRHGRLPWVTGVAALSAATAAWVWLAPGTIPDDLARSVDARSALGGVVLVGIAWLLIHDAAAGSRAGLLVLPLFAALDLGLWGYSYAWSRQPLTIAEVAALAEIPPSFSRDTRVHIGDLDARRNLSLLHGLTLFEPYVGLVPARHLNPGSPEAQRLGGVEWVLRNGTWIAVPDPFPRVRVLAEARRSARPQADVRTTDLSRVALTSIEIPALDQEGSGDARIVLDQPGRLQVDVVARGRLLLVTTESYHSGWTATAEDRDLATVAVNGDFLGVILEPGEYRVDLRFNPASARTGIAISLVAAMLSLAIASASLRLRTRAGRA